MPGLVGALSRIRRSWGYLATYTLGVLRISFGVLGATELRVVLAAANVGVWLVPGVQVLGLRVLMFDIAGVLCTAGLLGIAVKATIENTVRLYRMERLPTAQGHGVLCRVGCVRNSAYGRERVR